MVTPNKKSELDIVLHYLSIGFTKKQIREKLGIKTTTLANRLRRLEDLGCIERKGKYLINVLRSSHVNPRVTKNKVNKNVNFNKRGHAHNFKIYFPKETNLKEKPKVKNEEKLNQLERLKFGSLKFIKKKYTIWINKETLTVYSNNSYYSDNALHSKFYALKDVDNLVQELKDRFNFNGKYGIEIFREHYGLILNKFAKWILKKGKKLYVQDIKGKTILWVDNSRKDDMGLTEFEGEDPITINNADTFFSSHEKHKFKVDADYTLNNFKESAKQIKKNAENLDYHAENMRSHVGATKDLSRAAKTINHNLEKQNKLFSEMFNFFKRVNK